MLNNKLSYFVAGAAAGAGLVTLRNALSRPAAKNIPKIKLHIYDHCPFCIRVELVLGWKGLPYERIVYGYGDTLGDPNKGLYYGGKTLTGKKQLPVLEVEDEKIMMPESGDIISYLERLKGPGHVLLPPASGRRDLRDLFNDPDFKESFNVLTRPEKIKMTYLKDWAKPEDIEYAKNKYEGQNFSYSAAEESAGIHVNRMNNFLMKLDKMVHSAEQLSEGPCAQTWDDVIYLPTLRTLSCAKGLTWPKKLKSYVVNTLEKAKVQSYFSED